MKNPRLGILGAFASPMGAGFVMFALDLVRWLNGSLGIPYIEALVILLFIWLRWTAAREADYIQKTIDDLRRELSAVTDARSN